MCGIFIPKMNESPAASMAFWFASLIIPASATTVTSGSWWAAMNTSITGSIVLVSARLPSNADTRRQKGTRPDFSQAAPKEVAEPLYERFCDELRALGVPVETGVFGAYIKQATRAVASRRAAQTQLAARR